MTKRQKQNLIKGILTVICLGVLALLWFVILPGQEEAETPTYDVPEGTAEIHFIDVGQGDSALIKVGEQNILIDTGERSAEAALLKYLDDHGVEEIEYFIVTHFDADHFGNATKVLDTYDVKKLIIPNQVRDTKTYEAFIKKVEEQSEAGDIEVLNANEMVGDKLLISELEMTVLAPLREYEDSNDFSVTVMVRYGNRRVLLSGDAEKEAEADIVEKYTAAELDCDIFKLGHHGSRTSSSQELLDLATPEYIIICCGVGNEYGHPHKEVMERVEGLEIYRTDEDGSIVVSIANDEITFKTEK